MALFQKQPINNTGAPSYSIGTRKTVLIIGLGNPGEEYADTRHNIGFAAIEEFARKKEFPPWTLKKDLKAQITNLDIESTSVILMKSETFMNLSGEAVSAVQRYYRVYNSSTLVVYDELALPFGQIRTRLGGTDAGHNGIKSLIQYLGDDFGRLRIGIDSEDKGQMPTDKFVLAKFSEAEQGKIPKILDQATDLLSQFVRDGSLPDDTKNIA